MRKKKIYSRMLILGIFTYIIFQISTVFASRNIETISIKPENLSLKIKTKGLVIKDEQLIFANSSGVVKNLHKEGEKVKKAEKISNIYTKENIDIKNEEIKKLSKDISDLRVSIKNNKNSMKNSIMTNQMQTKINQREILEKEINSSTSYVKSNISGIISYKRDEYEDKYNLDSISNLTKEDIENTNNNIASINYDNKKVKEGEAIAKIVNNNNFYIAVCIEDEKLEYLNVGKGIKIGFNGEEINAKIDEIYQNNKENIVIFKITGQNVGIYDTRVKEFDIIYKQIEGLKIPKESIEIVKNKKGVYVLNEQTGDFNFKELKGIVYEDDGYVFIDNYYNETRGNKTVTLYDKIILKPNIINKNMKLK